MKTPPTGIGGFILGKQKNNLSTMVSKTHDFNKGAAPFSTPHGPVLSNNNVTTHRNTKNYNTAQLVPPLPHIELEQMIIGAILLQPDSTVGPSSISRCQEVGIEPEHFGIPSHQTIYRAFLHLVKEGKPTDPWHTTMLLHSWGDPFGDSQTLIIRFLERTIGTANLDVWAKDLIEIAERRQSVTPETDTERRLRGFQAAARDLLMDDKISNSERSVRLEALKDEYELNGQTFNNLINPVKKEVSQIRLRLELNALLQESDPVEKEFLLRDIAETYRMSQGTLKTLLTALKTQTETTHTRCLSLSELFDAESTAINWLVPGLLPKGETVLLVAPPKCGKTLMSVDLAYCLATGEDYFLNNSEFGTSEPKKVLLVSVDESTQSTTAKLFHRGFRREDENIQVLTDWNIHQTKALEEILEDWRPDLVIVDSLKRINHGSPISENSAEFADNIYSLKELFNRYGASGILIHHSSKDKDQQGVYRSRGSSAIAGAVWGVWQLDQMPKPDPDNPKKQIVDPNDPKRRFYAYSRDVEGASYILEFDPERHSFAMTLEGLSEKDQRDKSLPEKIKKLLELNKKGLRFSEILDLLGKEGGELPNKNSVSKALSRLKNKRVIGVKVCPENKRNKLYYLPDFEGKPNTTTEGVAQDCSTTERFSTPPSPSMSSLEMSEAVTLDKSETQVHDTIGDASPQKLLTEPMATDSDAEVASGRVTEVKEIDYYEESGLSKEEVSELEQLAKAETNKSAPNAQFDSIEKFKIGNWAQLTDGRGGYIEFIDRSKNECWLKVSSQGTARVKKPYTVKVPFENIKK